MPRNCPIEQVKKNLVEVMKAHFFDKKPVAEVQRRWSELMTATQSKQFDSWRRGFGKVSLDLPEDTPGVKPKNTYFQAWFEFTRYMNEGNAYAKAGLTHLREFDECLSGMHTYLELMKMDQEVIDEVMAGGR